MTRDQIWSCNSVGSSGKRGKEDGFRRKNSGGGVIVRDSEDSSSVVLENGV